MDNAKILEVAASHAKKLRDRGNLPHRNIGAHSRDEREEHLLYLCEQIPELLKEGRKEKANRWLGFIQGSLWMMDLHTIQELKESNMPDGATPSSGP